MSGPWEAYAPQPSTSEGPWAAYASQAQTTAQPERGGIKQGVGNLLAGVVRGAGSIGSTLLAPIDMASDAIAGKGLTLESNRQRRADMDSALGSMGAETDSWMYKGGKLAGEIAGTAGAGGAIANVAGRGIGAVAPQLLPRAQPLLSAIQTSGMTAPGGGMLTRMAGSAVTGGASAALVDPEDAVMGAAIGGAAPAVFKGMGKAGAAMGEAYRSAKTPDKVKIAQRLAAQTGASVDDVISALSQHGPQLIDRKSVV